MISVIMANYNGEKYLREAISSVIDQDYDDYEFIIVDDGSTDKSKIIISEFKNRNNNKINAIFLPSNSGQGVAFNVGIEASRGDLICLIDSDDLWYPHKLKNIDALFSMNKGGCLYQHNLNVIKDNEPTDTKFRNILINGDYFNYTREAINRRKWQLPHFIPTSGLSFPRHILEKVLPIPGIFRTCADGYLTRTCFCYGEVISTNESWGAYRIHSANNTFANSGFDTIHYVEEILIPELNKYYSKTGQDLKFPNVYKSKSAEISEAITPPIVPRLTKKLIKYFKIS